MSEQLHHLALAAPLQEPETASRVVGIGAPTEQNPHRRGVGLTLALGAGAASLSLLLTACGPAETTAQPLPTATTATTPPCGDLAPPLITGSYSSSRHGLPVTNVGNPVCVYSAKASNERIGIIPAPGALDLLCRSPNGDTMLVIDPGVINSTGMVRLTPTAQLETRQGGPLHELATTCPPPEQTPPTPGPTTPVQFAMA